MIKLKRMFLLANSDRQNQAVKREKESVSNINGEAKFSEKHD